MAHDFLRLFTALVLCACGGVAYGQSGADLSVALTGPLNATFGDRVVYSLAITNLGPAAATNVVVTVVSPFEVFSIGSCANGFPCGIGTLASGQGIVVSLYVRTPYLFCPQCNDPAPLFVVASVLSDTQDPTQSNNSSIFETALLPVRKITSVPIVAPWSRLFLIALLALSALARLQRFAPAPYYSFKRTAANRGGISQRRRAAAA